MVCTRCGIVGADARPNWLEPPPETLTGCNGGERRWVIRIKAPVFCRAYLISGEDRRRDMWTNVCRHVCVGAVVGASLIIGAQIASAQGYASLSCGQLWQERNAIFAEYGYCFKTPQAISAFGRGCFPPYGRLPSSAQHRVDDIISWERRKGCSG
jgi:hypothetical protein